MKPNERRHFWRATFHSPVRLTTDDGQHFAQLLDISLKGALVENHPGLGLVAGDACQLRVELAPGAAITMWTSVAHAEANHLGLRCERIDVDSMTHLRRMVELNAGDPQLLERELGALVATA